MNSKEAELLQALKISILEGLQSQLDEEKTINPEAIDIYLRLTQAGF